MEAKIEFGVGDRAKVIARTVVADVVLHVGRVPPGHRDLERRSHATPFLFRNDFRHAAVGIAP